MPKLEAFVVESLKTDIPVPPKRPKTAARGPWASMTPEERSAYSRKIAANKDPANNRGGDRRGIPRHLTAKQYQALVASQKPIIARIMKKMADNGTLPDDPRAAEALEESVTVLRTAQDAKVKLSAARLILDFTKSKPTAKVEHTVKTAEDLLDEMAADDE